MAFQRTVLFVALTLFFVGCSSEKPSAPAGAAASSSASRPCAFCPEQSPQDCTLCVASNPLFTVDKNGATCRTRRRFRDCQSGGQTNRSEQTRD